MTHLWIRPQFYSSPSIAWRYLPTTFITHTPWNLKFMLEETLHVTVVNNLVNLGQLCRFLLAAGHAQIQAKGAFPAYGQLVLHLLSSVSWKIWQHQPTVDSFQLQSVVVSTRCLDSTRPQQHNRSYLSGIYERNKITLKILKSLMLLEFAREASFSTMRTSRSVGSTGLYGLSGRTVCTAAWCWVISCSGSHLNLESHRFQIWSKRVRALVSNVIYAISKITKVHPELCCFCGRRCRV